MFVKGRYKASGSFSQKSLRQHFQDDPVRFTLLLPPPPPATAPPCLWSSTSCPFKRPHKSPKSSLRREIRQRSKNRDQTGIEHIWYHFQLQSYFQDPWLQQLFQLFSPDEREQMKYRYIFKKAHFASYTLMRMMLEKNRKTIKHPRMKGQKRKKLIGIKDQKVMVSMAIKTSRHQP